MQPHCHYKMHNNSSCSSCKMPLAWDSPPLSIISADEASSSSQLPACNTYLKEDPVLHRLHCQVSDCVQCRCDSGYNTVFKCSSSFSSSEKTSLHSCCRYGYDCHHDDIPVGKQHSQHRSSVGSIMNHRHNLLLSRLSPTSTMQSSPVVKSYQCCCCERFQYCCVCTINASSICSDHVTPRSSVSSSCVCSCIRKTLNLQPETNSNTDVIASVTNPNPPHHGRRCGCSSWAFALATLFQSFISRFSGRLRRPQRRRLLTSSSLYGWEKMTSFLYTFVTVATFCLSFLPLSDACSSRSTPKPRPPSPTLRPNITIQTYTCPPEYDAHYCLNGATCFTVKIGESILYNCECAEGYMGQRCEFKDLDGSYLPSKQRAMLEQAGLTSGAAIIVVIVVIVCFYLYVRSRRKSEISQRLSRDVPDGMEYGYENERRPFSGYYYSPSLSHNSQNHHIFHSPTNNINTSYHQPHPQQQRQHQPLPVCISSSPSHCSEHVPPSPTNSSPLPIYQRATEPPPDPSSSS